jgi:hypothetical protein
MRSASSLLLALAFSAVPFVCADAQPAPAAATAAAPLDYEFFKVKVQPIFLAKRAGHARCISCHTMRLPQLQPLAPGSKTWDDAASRKNFESIQRVAKAGNLKSPLLVHALEESAGGDFYHSGGKHFMSQNDPEWQTLKAFVMGQTLGGTK